MALGDNKLSVFVSLRAEQFNKGLKKVQSGFKGLNRTIGAFSTAFVGQQIFQLGKQFADAAGEMETVERSFARSFAGIADSAENELKKLSSTLGRNETALKKGAISFNAFFRGLGFVSKEAANMSVKMQTLSLDLASFFGIADSNAQKRFLAALAGSPEVLDQFGINLKQSALQLELYRMGLKSTVQNTSEVIKTQGRLNIIMRAMTDSGIMGDAKRGLTTYQGQLVQFNAAWKTFSEDVGKLVIPSIIKITNKLTNLFNIIKAGVSIISQGGIAESLNKQLQLELFALEEKDIELEKEALITVKKTKLKQQDEVGLMSAMEFEEQQRKRILSDEDLSKLAAYNVLMKKIDLQMEGLNNKSSKFTELSRKSNALGVLREAITKKVTDQLKKEELVRNEFIIKQNQKAEGLKSAKDEEKEYLDIQKLTIPEIEKELKLQKDLLKIAKEINGLTGVNQQEVNALEEKIEILDNLIGRVKEVPQKSLKGAVDISSKEVDLKTGHVISDTEARDNMGVLLGLGNTKQQENSFNEIMARQSKRIVAIAKGSSEGLSKAVPAIEAGALQLLDILRPIADAMTQIFVQMLTPPDTTISEQEQREKTLAAFGGIMVGLGQALFSLGMGSLLVSMGLKDLGKNPALAIAMMGMGAGLISIGKGKLQKAREMGVARTGGGGANSGSGTGNFTGMMEAIQGEQVFRLAGNDLVTALNRTNNFQGAIGG